MPSYMKHIKVKKTHSPITAYIILFLVLYTREALSVFKYFQLKMKLYPLLNKDTIKKKKIVSG